ncbi:MULTISPECIES: carbohydrate ABC transporter permease [Paenibacillus]|jgi:putative aldouronate transport system permease protein|uniref:ABC transporter permease n=1 Tax=Paenibacillus odorifer TaxID=189426 RepID=A0ABX3GQV8_9BACL|nr:MULTISPECIES: carbohydrate ABC transporter permease [Paenibacillus]AIQ73514.1 ABC transporter permease [Paenibacillus odorifer]ETT64251.1 binding-protein-dependent transport system inner membrane protein [Paenibacillus sp. FSL H8-237]MDH6426344.1 putative aldouronate transport system permease protein [Paenibacillus sp. PastH-4]MDH6442367.1 putative aldouronate transport system permease protein [Paenibacillus sp. PastF-4]MDH6526920.1 putative aldouronate transport system permease protein [Pa
MVEDKTISGRIFSAINFTLLAIIALITVLPLVHVVAGSFTTSAELASSKFVLIPKVWSLEAYKFIFSTNTIFKAMGVSIGVTAIGSIFSLFITSLMAYALTRKDLDGRKVVNFMVVFTMLFHGGMIPTFLVVKELGLIDTYASLILPSAISAFNMIILRNFFQNIPEGLEESAKIDGCNDFGILFRIVLPLSLPALATIGLFYAVTYWNTYMNAILYLNDSAKWPIQVLLRQIVVLASGMDHSATLDAAVPPPDQSIKMAVIVVATLPIVCVYPFLQKHFAKGAMLGSMKG